MKEAIGLGLMLLSARFICGTDTKGTIIGIIMFCVGALLYTIPSGRAALRVLIAIGMFSALLFAGSGSAHSAITGLTLFGIGALIFYNS